MEVLEVYAGGCGRGTGGVCGRVWWRHMEVLWEGVVEVIEVYVVGCIFLL